MRGRKPKPAALKLVGGNPGKRPVRREPRPPGGQPTCRTHLSPTAKVESLSAQAYPTAGGAPTSRAPGPRPQAPIQTRSRCCSSD